MTQDDLDAAVDEAREAIRATLHKLAEALGQSVGDYDMRVTMDTAHDLLNDFDPVVNAQFEIEAENARLAREEERDLYRNAPIVI